MDEIVKQAMVKWPDVPECYGWLALDARGAWRMRDDRVRALDLPGDKIVHPALLGFINRNYLCDKCGCWFFQNGPQRVFVDLAATPYIARTDPVQGFVLHTGEPVPLVDDVWITEAGQLIVEGNAKVAQLDDRDIAELLPHLHIDGQPIDDEQLLAWLNNPTAPGQLTLATASRLIPVQRLAAAAVASHFGFVQRPQQ